MSCCVVKCSLRTVVGEMVDFVVVGAAAISAGEVTTCCCFSCCFEFQRAFVTGLKCASLLSSSSSSSSQSPASTSRPKWMLLRIGQRLQFSRDAVDFIFKLQSRFINVNCSCYCCFLLCRCSCHWFCCCCCCCCYTYYYYYHHSSRSHRRPSVS